MLIGKTIIRLEKTNSTNLFLQEAVKKDIVKEGTAIIAHEQTDGRGQQDNRWESNSGENITLSFVLYPEFIEVQRQFMLSKFVALGIYDLLYSFSDKVKIKWPNDIYISNKKIAGVLIENSIKGSVLSTTVIGIGLNINQKKFSPDLSFATSLSIETGKDYSIESITEQLFDKLNVWYYELKDANFKKIDESYLNVLYQFNEFHNYQAGNKIFKAKIIQIEKDGRLCLQTDKNKLLKFAFKEVIFL